MNNIFGKIMESVKGIVELSGKEPVIHKNHNSPRQWQSIQKPRPVKSKGALLVLLLSLLIDSGYLSTLNSIASMIFSIVNFESDPLQYLVAVILLGIAIPQLFYPIAGWIADARLGRYRAIEMSLWLLYIGNCVLFFPFLFLQLIGKEDRVYIIFPLAYVIINLGLAGFRTNIIQFGMDQTVDASGSEQSAFIHWYYWSMYAGTATASSILGCLYTNFLPFVIAVGINVLLTGLALFLWYCLNPWFIKEPITNNPFKTVYMVLKYSSIHKAPLYRSALTYWDDIPPSRLDLGKSKFGGPFSTEEVEDVKTFFATALVLLSIGGFIVINYTFESFIIHEMADPSVGVHCTLGDILTSENLIILIGIPIYELVICPIVQNYVPTILKRIGIGIIVDIVAVLSAFILDLYINSQSVLENSHQTRCVLATNVTNSTISSGFIIIPMFLDTTAELLVSISALEFIFAQSPYGMRSMLVGTYYTIQGVFQVASVLIAVTVGRSWQDHQSSRNVSCGTVYYSVMILVGIIGIVAYTILARRYKKRQRDEHIEQYMIVEDYYSKATEADR